MAYSVSNFVAMATGVGHGKIYLMSVNSLTLYPYSVCPSVHKRFFLISTKLGM